MTRGLVTSGLVVAILALVIWATAFRSQTHAQPPAAPAACSPKYTIVETDGTNLLVVDNASNTLYFYTLDPGKEVGDDLNLRGSLDLTQVGKPTLKPKKSEK